MFHFRQSEKKTMKKKQNTTAFLLMALSLILLFVSQWFWIKSEFKDKTRSFYNQSDLLLKETVRSLEDSSIRAMVFEGLIKLESRNNLNLKVGITLKDSNRNKEFESKTLNGLDKRLENHFKNNKDFPRIEGLKKSKLEKTYFGASRDSVEILLNQRAKEIGYDITYTVTKDSISKDSSFRRGNFRRFHKKRDNLVDTDEFFNHEKIRAVSILPYIRFEAVPNNLDAFIFRDLLPNIAFSAILILIIGISFFSIYRNLRKQSKLNELKDDLISNISHELKTPLTTLNVALEALQQLGQNVKPDTLNEYLDISRGEVTKLSQMVENILKTSLLEQNQIELNKTDVNLLNLLENTVKSWQPRFKKTNGTLDLKSLGTDFYIKADEIQLLSILNNLLDNSLKYSKENPEVTISLSESRDMVTVKVKDNGIGIPEEYQEQIFDKFFRVPTGNKHNVKGYGLGLNFVKHIMDLHQGKISLRSGSSGTDFTLIFKREQ